MTEASLFSGGRMDIINGEQVRVSDVPDVPIQSVDFHLPSVAQANLLVRDLSRGITPVPDTAAAHDHTQLEIAMTIAQGVNLGAAARSAEKQAGRRVATAERAVRNNGITDEAWLAEKWRGPQFKYEMFASLTEQVQLRLRYGIIEFVTGAKPYDERALGESEWRRTTTAGALSGLAPGFAGAMVAMSVPGEQSLRLVLGVGTTVGLLGLTEIRNRAEFGHRDKATRQQRNHARRLNNLVDENTAIQNSIGRSAKVVPKFKDV